MLYDRILKDLAVKPKRWLVTGAAGFIGSHIAETLLRAGQHVVGLDNFSTGKRSNLKDIEERVGAQVWKRFQFFEGTITDAQLCRKAAEGVDVITHQAALGSVPRSIENPVATNEANVVGFLVLAKAAADAGVKRFVYASSSSIYGDHPDLPKVENQVGRPLSPYAASKHADELYAYSFAECYRMETVGLRYFNVFGPRQDPEGPYAAVIPKWVATLIKGDRCTINGDGTTSRDFCYVDNAVQANILAGVTDNREALNRAYNVACGDRTSLGELFGLLVKYIAERNPEVLSAKPQHGPFRPGDVKHSLAEITLAKELLGYAPQFSLSQGLAVAVPWYLDHL